MAGKNRTTSLIVELVVIAAIVAGFMYVGSDYLRMNKEKSELNANIDSLQQEINRMREEEELSAAAIVEKEGQLAEMQSLPERITAQREEYYAVCKQLEDKVLEGTANYKIAYMTFDDGPYVGMTEKYLQVLEDYGILATFFEIAREGEEYDPIYHKVYEAGHTIANHTYGHQMKGYLYESVDNFVNDIIKNREFIQEKLGITTNIMRFPGGAGSAGSLKPGIVEKLRELGYGYVDWTAATGDGIGVYSVEDSIENVLHTYNWGGDLQVVLMHDYSPNSLEALPVVLDAFKEQGYIFLPLFYESSVIIK